MRVLEDMIAVGARCSSKCTFELALYTTERDMCRCLVFVPEERNEPACRRWGAGEVKIEFMASGMSPGIRAKLLGVYNDSKMMLGTP